MEAKIKATGKAIVVEPYGDEFAQILPEGDYKVYTKQELVFSSETDWQHYRIQAAIAALNGITSSGSFEQHTLEDMIAECMILADALIAELQKKGGQDD